MAPEQALSGRLGPYTDIYAVGVMAYEMLAGRPPFGNGSTPMAVLYAHVHNPPPPLADLAPDTPEPVRRWVEWLLAKAPEDRPASAAQAWEALEEIAVAELGPYWRRSAAVLRASRGGHDRADHRGADQRSSPPSTRDAARAAAAPPPAEAAAPCSPAAWRRSAPPPSRRSSCRSPAARLPRRAAAVPFDFDGDRRQELVLGMPGSAQREDGAPGGLVVIHRGDRGATPTVITPRDAGLPAPYATETTSAGARRAATSTATAGPTWRSASRGGSSSRSSTEAPTGC